MAEYIDLSNSDIVAKYFDIAVWAHKNNQSSLYQTALQTIEKLIKSDLGKVMVMSLREIPSVADDTEVIKKWEAEAMKRGIIFKDTKTNHP